MSALKDFYQLLDDYKKTLAWALGSSAILPMIASFAGLAPVWPPAAALLTSLFTLIGIVFAFQIFRKAPKRKIDRTMLWSLLCLVVFLITYLSLFELFTFKIPTTGEVVHVGCGWSDITKEIASTYGINLNKGCPGSYERIFAASSYENTVVWDRIGLMWVKLGMALAWFCFFASVAVLLAVFLVFQSRQKSLTGK